MPGGDTVEVFQFRDEASNEVTLTLEPGAEVRFGTSVHLRDIGARPLPRGEMPICDRDRRLCLAVAACW